MLVQLLLIPATLWAWLIVTGQVENPGTSVNNVPGLPALLTPNPTKSQIGKDCDYGIDITASLNSTSRSIVLCWMNTAMPIPTLIIADTRFNHYQSGQREKTDWKQA